jgi:hypothetical protein
LVGNRGGDRFCHTHFGAGHAAFLVLFVFNSIEPSEFSSVAGLLEFAFSIDLLVELLARSTIVDHCLRGPNSESICPKARRRRLGISKFIVGAGSLAAAASLATGFSGTTGL